jgi:stearoyl-CoA desaturase (delta-9 desaturase)
MPLPSVRQRAIMVVLTVLPFAAVVAAIALLWNSAVGAVDLALFAGFYLATGFGVTVGFHRMLTHRAFDAPAPVRATLLALGSMSLQGAAIDWAVDHRTHHAFSDKEGDPHSPHHGFPDTIWGELRGLVHAHMGWMFAHRRRHADRFAKDLLADPVTVAISRSFPLWVLLGQLLPFAIGYAVSGSWKGGLTGLLWGGLVRLFFNHHVTWSVNSICHFFGRRPFQSHDLATNNWLLALPSLGEAWHHNHHVFPTSAYHGLERGQIDLSALLIRGMEKLRLVRTVRRPSAEQLARKRAPA